MWILNCADGYAILPALGFTPDALPWMIYLRMISTRDPKQRERERPEHSCFPVVLLAIGRK